MEPRSLPSLRHQIPIGMLITEVTFLPDDSAELFGFWYYKERTIPETREEDAFSCLTSLQAAAAY